MAPVASVEEVQRLLSEGRARDAAEQLLAAADRGDADALFMLATWRVSGRIIRRDLPAARELMRRAARAGHREAGLLHAHFLANGTGGPSDWRTASEALSYIADSDSRAAEQIGMLQGMPVDANGEPTAIPPLKRLSARPEVFMARAFLRPDECEYLVRQAEPALMPSIVTERATGRRVLNPIRRSDGMFFGVGNEDLVVNAINRRIAVASGTTPEQGEPLQVLRYGVGGEFKPHCDFEKDTGNQRILTALVYLSDDYEGGETKFLRTGLSFRGEVGDLLLFRNVTEDGSGDLMAEHAGLPVTSGTKIIASRWIWRERPRFEPPTPMLPIA